MSEIAKLNLFALFALIGLTLILISVFNIKATVTSIQLLIHKNYEIFLTNGETRVIVAMFGMLIIVVLGFVIFDVPIEFIHLICFIVGAILVWAGIVKNKIVLAFMYILPSKWRESKYDGITNRVIIVILGAILLFFTITTFFEFYIK